jgi:hypothetical protein
MLKAIFCLSIYRVYLSASVNICGSIFLSIQHKSIGPFVCLSALVCIYHLISLSSSKLYSTVYLDKCLPTGRNNFMSIVCLVPACCQHLYIFFYKGTYFHDWSIMLLINSHISIIATQESMHSHSTCKLINMRKLF